MSEETKTKAVELSDEEAANAAGGMAPEGFTPCPIRYGCPRGTSFCAYSCTYRGTQDCLYSYCRKTLCDEIKAMYQQWIETNR